jgi:hypothetical protein
MESNGHFVVFPCPNPRMSAVTDDEKSPPNVSIAAGLKDETAKQISGVYPTTSIAPEKKAATSDFTQKGGDIPSEDRKSSDLPPEIVDSSNSFQFKFKVQGTLWSGEMITHARRVSDAVSCFPPEIYNMVTNYCLCRVVQRIHFNGNKLVDFCIMNSENPGCSCCRRFSYERCFRLGHTSFCLATVDRLFECSLEPRLGRRTINTIWKPTVDQKKQNGGDIKSMLCFRFPYNKKGSTKHGFAVASSTIATILKGKIKGRMLGGCETLDVLGFDPKSGHIFFRTSHRTEPNVRVMVVNINDMGADPETIIVIVDNSEHTRITYDSISGRFITLNFTDIFIFRPRTDKLMLVRSRDKPTAVKPDWAQSLTAIEMWNRETSGDGRIVKINLFVAMKKSENESVICVLRTSENDNKKADYSEPFYSQQSVMSRLCFHALHGVLYVIGDSGEQLVAIVPPEDSFKKTE